MSPDFWIGVVIGVGVFVLQAWVRRDADQRHARYRMRAKLAAWLMEGKLQPARARKGKLVLPVRRLRQRRAAQRDTVLPMVRRDDSGTGAA